MKKDNKLPQTKKSCPFRKCVEWIIKNRFWIFNISLLVFAIIGFVLITYYRDYLFNLNPDKTVDPESYFSLTWWRLYFLVCIVAAYMSIINFLKKLFIKIKNNKKAKKANEQY